MNVIYKYRLPFMEISKIEIHAGAKVIRIGGESGALWLWAIVDTDKPLVERTFYLYKTGGQMMEDINSYQYIGCGAIFVQMELMMYVFEKKSPEEVTLRETPRPFEWKDFQEGSNHAI